MWLSPVRDIRVLFKKKLILDNTFNKKIIRNKPSPSLRRIGSVLGLCCLESVKLTQS